MAQLNNSAQAYQQAYSLTGRSGKVAVLCEGDLLGYEAVLLDKFLRSRVNQDPPHLIDIWACGTKTALFGICDAIARSIDVLVIEDRDFRTVEESEKECAKCLGERRKRDLSVTDWRSWRRSEIENYLLDLEVLVPALTTAFNCEADTVIEGLHHVLQSLSIFQALQFVLYRCRTEWSRSDPAAFVPNRLKTSIRPQWTDANGFVNSTRETAEQCANALFEAAEEWQKAFGEEHVIAPNLIKVEFLQRYSLWENMEVNSDVWRMDWAGKEILKGLRMWLAHRVGWPVEPGGPRVQVSWESIKRSLKEDHDRRIESQIFGEITQQFLQSLLPGSPAFDEWQSIATALTQ